MTKKILAKLRDLGAWAVKYHGGPYATNGVPDILGCYRGVFFALEVKAGENKATQLQEAMIKQIHAAGGLAAVVHDVPEALAQIRRIDEWMTRLTSRQQTGSTN